MKCLIITIFIVILLFILHNIDNKCETFVNSSKRNIKIFASRTQMFNIKKIIESYKEEFNIRNVEIEYIVSTDFKAELYGYDGGLKKTITTNTTFINKHRDFELRLPWCFVFLAILFNLFCKLFGRQSTVFFCIYDAAPMPDNQA